MSFRTIFVACALLAATPAFAKNVTAANPKAVADLLQSMGYRAEMNKTEQGDPMIDSSAAGVNFSVYFYGCNNGKDCTSIQLSSGFNLEFGTTLDVVNEWNSSKRFGKVFLDETNDPFIDVDVNLYDGGISEETFRDVISSWDQMLADFQKHINW